MRWWGEREREAERERGENEKGERRMIGYNVNGGSVDGRVLFRE